MAPELDKQNQTIEGRTLGEFVVKEKLGAGGYGEVYLATQPALQREAVIKVLRERHRTSAEPVRRFLREAKLASTLDHPFAAHIYAFGAEPDGLLWIAMELVRGTPLDRLIKLKGPLPIEHLVPFLDRLCEVLHTAHEQGIVHRDIKPANVMVLTRAGRLLPKLLDLGIAKATALVEELEAAVPAASAAPGTEAGLNETVRPGVTREGVIIGSPPYMAPEQWAAEEIVPQTDQYALAALAYEALTGRWAFNGTTRTAIAMAHATGRVAPLGGSLPVQLDGVLARAFSRRASDRYPSVMEFAAAFRTAAGLRDERVDLPRLPHELRDRVVVEAPQPLAEAVAQLHGAHGVHQAYGAVEQVLAILIHYLGLLALACHTSAPGGGRDGEAVQERLRALRSRALTDEEWLDFARVLLRPYAELRELCPVPELLDLLCSRAGDDPFDTLVGARGSLGGSELDVRERLLRAMPALERLLRAAAPLWSYPLVVSHAGEGELWMGLRTRRRRSIPIVRHAIEDGRVLLVTCDGAPLLQLWPLVQALRPTAGSEPELFSWVGHGRKGARLVARPSGFERVDDELISDWLRQQLSVDDSGQHGIVKDEASSPYRGLRAFGPEDTALFFGREREIDEALNQLRIGPLMTVVGPSGAGKSSFVHAGLLPNLPDGWRAISLRPGAAPMASLAARIKKEGGPAEVPRGDGDALLRALAALAGEGVLVLVVDQLEEIFTLCTDTDERRRFLEALAACARSPEQPTRVVLTLRDDFLIRAEQEEGLRAQLARSLLLLTTPQPADLMRTLVEPARAFGYAFEDRALPEEMTRDVAGRPGAMPLVSFAATRLWETRDRHFRQLTRKAYQAMGGVTGALAQHAETTLRELGQTEQRLVREIFRHLVTAEGTRAVIPRDELEQLLGGATKGAATIEKLLTERLLVVSEGATAGQIEIAHEALVTAWPRLAEWRKEDAEGARLRDQLRAAARQWDDRGRPEGLLWRGDALVELELWQARHPQPLATAEAGFARASQLAMSRSRRRRRNLVVLAFLALVVGLGLVLHFNREARRQLAANSQEQGRELFLSGDPLRALVHFDKALSLGADNGDLRFMLARALASLDAERLRLGPLGGRVLDARFTADAGGILTVTDDGFATLFDAASGVERRRFAHPNIATTDVSTDGRLLITSGGGTVRLWEVDSGRVRFTFDGLVPDRPARRAGLKTIDASLSPDGQRLLAIGADHLVHLFSTRDGSPLGVLRGHTDEIFVARFRARGTRVVSASKDGSARLWEVESGRLIGTFKADEDRRVFAVDLSPDGSRLITGGPSEVRVWDARAIRPLGHVSRKSSVVEVLFSPDGRSYLARGEAESNLEIWDAASGQRRALLLGHRGHVNSAAFSPDGTQLVTSSDDGMAKIWGVESGRLVTSLVGHAGSVERARWSSEGSLVLTAGSDRTARTFSPHPTELELSLAHDGATGARFDREGTKIFSEAQDQTLRAWDAADGRSLSSQVLPVPPSARAYEDRSLWAADGRHAFTLRGPSAPLWEVASARRVAELEATAILTWIDSSPDGARAAGGTTAGTVEVWELASGRRQVIAAHQGAVVAVAFSPDGTRLVSVGEDALAKIWRADSGALLQTLRGHVGRVEWADFSPDGKRLVTAGLDQSLRLWNVESGALEASFYGHVAQVFMASFSADGERIASAAVDGVKIWAASSGRLLASYDEPLAQSALFGAKDQRLVIAGLDAGVEIFRAGLERRAPSEISRLIACRVPFRLQGDGILPVEPAAGDCSSLRTH